MADVLLLSLVFPPDSVSTAQIMGELAVDLAEHGHRVSVISTVPHYNRNPEREKAQPLKRKWGKILYESEYRGLRIYHVFMPPKGASIPRRLFAWAFFHFMSVIAGWTLVPRPSVVLAPSPPLTIGFCAWLLGLSRGAPYIYNVQEIYPDIAIRLGAVRNRWVIAFLLGLEKLVYSKAAAVTVIAPRMRERLMEKGVPPGKVQVIPNFVDIGDFAPLPKDNDFSRRHGLHRAFVVSYAGNMGPAQGLESFVEAARILREQESIRFVMMGDGILRESIERSVESLALGNFVLLPYQSYSLMGQAYAASDLCLVPQALETGCDAIPSKVYRIMACARPVLASTDKDSDLARLVEAASCGECVSPGSSESLAEAILRAARKPDVFRLKGLSGREYVVHHFSRRAVTDQYEALIAKIAALHVRSSAHAR